MTASFMYFHAIIMQSVAVAFKCLYSHVQDGKPTKLARGRVTYLDEIKIAENQKKKKILPGKVCQCDKKVLSAIGNNITMVEELTA